MSDEPTDAASDLDAVLPVFAELEQLGVRDWALPYPYAALDAGLYAFFYANGARLGIHFQRKVITSGSANYEIYFSESRLIGVLSTRSIDERVSLVSVTNPGSITIMDRPAPTLGVLIWLFNVFINWFNDQHARFTEIAERAASSPPFLPSTVTSLAALKTAIPPKRGRPTAKHNDWAREQINAGQPSDEVFEEYLTRLKIRAKTPQERERARARFRRAIGERTK